jgi:hypothetical protein
MQLPKLPLGRVSGLYIINKEMVGSWLDYVGDRLTLQKTFHEIDTIRQTLLDGFNGGSV